VNFTGGKLLGVTFKGGNSQKENSQEEQKQENSHLQQPHGLEDIHCCYMKLKDFSFTLIP
jgi:hypothetical protein